MWYDSFWDIWICKSCMSYVKKFGTEYICENCGPFELMKKRYLEHDHKCLRCGKVVYNIKKDKKTK